MRKIVLLSLLLLFACKPADKESGPGPETGAVESKVNTASTDIQPEAFAGSYPASHKVDQVDNYHGTDVADPYRWLEDDVRESSQVSEWVEQQNKVTFAYLESIPEREKIKQRLTALWDYAKYGVPFNEGGKYFYFKNNGLQNQSVLFMQETLDSEPRLVVDPNTWSADGTVALADVEISPDGRYAAMAIQDGGSDWRTVRILNIDSGEQLENELEWVKFSPLVWKPDSSGIFYSRFPAPERGDEFQSLNKNQRIYFHQVGDSQEKDLLVYSRDDQPDWLLLPNISEDGRFLIITAMISSGGNQIAFLDLSDAEGEPIFLTDNFDHEFSFVGSMDSRLFFRTNKHAPRSRLIAVDAGEPKEENWKELVPESDSVMRGAALVRKNRRLSILPTNENS